MRLADLKQGMVCELRNGYEIIILSNDKYVFDVRNNVIYHYQLSKDYNDNLINIDGVISAGIDYDIMKVKYGDKVLFEREESKWFEPKENEGYYHISPFGKIVALNNKRDEDKEIIAFSQVFKTREEAQAHLKYKQAELKIIKWIAQNDNVVLDWNNEKQPKYFITYFNKGKTFNVDNTWLTQFLPKHFYLSSEELAQRLIDELGTELKIWFGVEK